MTSSTTASPRLRLWPGVLIVVVQWLAVFGSGMIAPASPLQFFGMLSGPVLAVLLFAGWWPFASRAPHGLRWLGTWLPFAGLAVVLLFAHRSAPTAVVIVGIPLLCALFVSWAAISQDWRPAIRKRSMVAVLLATLPVWLLLRVEGVDGDMNITYDWRWAATAEERLLAETDDATRPGRVASIGDDVAWPGFRGPRRDGVITGVGLATDWQQSPPTLLWKRPIGPGWGSIAIAGDVLYTQEQRGDDELVASYDASTGEPIWIHRDPARFWEALAGAGPRATPTLDGDRIYALGATGILNALDAADGSVRWRRDLTANTGAPVPDWGFASSPLATGDLVIVHAGGSEGKDVVAYDRDTGAPRWFATAGQLSYSAVHETHLGGVHQLLVATGAGLTSLEPRDGGRLWHHAWQVPGGARIVQPAVVDERTVLLGTGFAMGVRKLTVTRGAGGFVVDEGWTSIRLKPYYNDFVVHRGFAYGFDGRILAAIDLATGERAWKGGRYGHGQTLLLADQDLLVVLADRGDVALVAAEPDAFRELARIEVLQGKTWNHPVIAHGVLYVRNGEEMAALRLPTLP